MSTDNAEYNEEMIMAMMNEEDVRQFQTAQELIQTYMAELPDELTSPYREACSRAPYLVATESDPQWFLRFHEFDHLSAARRMANYWKMRKEAFQERTFLPIIDLSGNGAMTREDLKVLQTGYCINLPRDLKNRTVIYQDTSKRSVDTPPSLRTIFFVFQHAIENETTRQRDGFVALFNVSNPFAANFVAPNLQCSHFLMKECMPIKNLDMHCIHIPPPGTNIDQSFIDTVYKWGLDRLGSVYGESVHAHVASSKEDCLSKLMRHDLTPEGLPVGLGGSWSAGCEPWGNGGQSDNDNDNSNLTLEIETDLSCLFRNALWCHNQAVAKQQQQNEQEQEQQSALPSSSFVTASGTVPSTTHQSSDRASESSLQRSSNSKRAAGQQEQQEPTASGNSLQGPTAAARSRSRSKSRSRAKLLEGETEEERDKRRKRHVQYGRRNREKEKIEIHVMVQEHHRLSSTNQALRAEGQRLEELLGAAEQEIERSMSHQC